MATVRFTPAAAPVAEVWTVTITANDTATTYTLTINGKTLAVAGNAGGANDTATDIATAWADLDATLYPEFAEATAAAVTDTVTLTGPSTGTYAGKPLDITGSVSGGTGTMTVSKTTAGTSMHHWSNANNWSTGAVPANGDDVVIENSDVGIWWDLDQHSVALASLTINASYTGTIGLPEVNTDGSTSYHEYRGQCLQVGASAVTVGNGAGNGSPLIKIDSGSATAVTLTVNGTGSSNDPTLEPLLWKGTNASNVANLNKGTVAIAGYGGEAATLATLRVGYLSSQSSDVTLRCGGGLTLATLNMDGGDVTLNGSVTTVVKTAGTLTVIGSGTVGTLTDDDGTTYYQSSGTITTLNVGSGATVDFSRDMRARTVSACSLYEGGAINDPFKTVTWSAGIALVRCDVPDVTLALGVGRTLTPT